MFAGTRDRLNNNRRAQIQPFEGQVIPSTLFTPSTFTLLLLKSGVVCAQLGHTPMLWEAPCIVCVDEQTPVSLLRQDQVQYAALLFCPEFLNVNMTLSTIRSDQYPALCEQHSFFQLDCFLCEEPTQRVIHTDAETFARLCAMYEKTKEHLQQQYDFRWTCRSRSYFIDMINCLTRLFHRIDTAVPLSVQDASVIQPIGYSPEMHAVLTYVHNHLDEPLTLHGLCRRFFLHRNKLEALFKAECQTTFYAYIRQQRFSQASYYLRFTNLGCDHIASRIGISSSQNFCKFFKRIAGVSPGQFRREAVQERKQDDVLRKKKETAIANKQPG